MINAGVDHLIQTLENLCKKMQEEGADSFLLSVPFFGINESGSAADENETPYETLKQDIVALLVQKSKEKVVLLQTEMTAVGDFAHLLSKAGFQNHPVPLRATWAFDFEQQQVRFHEKVYCTGNTF